MSPCCIASASRGCSYGAKLLATTVPDQSRRNKWAQQPLRGLEWGLFLHC